MRLLIILLFNKTFVNQLARAGEATVGYGNFLRLVGVIVAVVGNIFPFYPAHHLHAALPVLAGCGKDNFTGGIIIP